MTEDELKKRIVEILEIGDEDPEVAHIKEDELHRELLSKYLPSELWVQIVNLENADFTRWYA